jgi:very-short-patch-repair endonuclease
MTYGNQREHGLLDRQKIKDYLLDLACSETVASPNSVPKQDHLIVLKRQAGSDLEIKWLDFLYEQGLRLPSKAQVLVESCTTRPDFSYEDECVAIYIDGPVHEYPERQQRDQEQTLCMVDRGYEVIRFGYEENWTDIVNKHAYIFGRIQL